MKKYLPIIGIFIGALILFGALFWVLKGRQVSPEVGKPSPPPTSVSVEQRPYVTLTPRADGHEFKLEIKNIKNAQVVEYELAYIAQEFSRGAIGEVKLEGQDSLTRNLLLGSESCSGTGEKRVCRYKYDEGVKEGILTLRFRGPLGTQKYEIAFHLQKGSEALQGLTSQDGNFEFQGNLPAGSFYAVYSPLGLPQPVKGQIVGGPYGIFTAGVKGAKGTIKLRLNQPKQKVSLLGWEGASWREYNQGFETDGQVVSVEVDRLTTFIAVSP